MKTRVKRWDRRTPTDDGVVAAAMIAGVERAKLVAFADGFRDGTRTTLELLLGNEYNETPGYPGPISEELRVWAERALGRVSG